MNRRLVKTFIISMALLTALLRYFLQGQSEFVESVYSRNIFIWVRRVFDHTLHHIGIPMIFVFLFFGVGYLMYIIVRLFRSRGELKSRILRFSFSLLSFLAFLYFSFMWLWGFNYLRKPIEDTLTFQPKPIAVAKLKEKLQERLPELISARNLLTSDSLAITEDYIPRDFEDKIRNYVIQALEENNYPAKTKVQGRFLPKGTLLRLSTAGIYFPFVGESNIDAGLHPLQYSETLAHEFAHGYGFGDEGTCSFVAYLSLKDASEPFLRYSLLLSYWRTLARNYLRYDNSDYQAYRLTLPAGLVADLNAIAENRQKYPSLFPNLRYQVYDSYLKAQGIKEGMKNYNRVIMLVEGFEENRLSGDDNED